MDVRLKKLGSSRTEALVTVPEDSVRTAETEVLRDFSKRVEIKGFRPGMAPLERVRAAIAPDRFREEVVSRLVPGALREIVQTHKLQPIIRPRVELQSFLPMILKCTLVEKPEVTVGVKNVQAEVKKKREERMAGKGHGQRQGQGKNGEQKDEPQDAHGEDEQCALEAVALHTKVELAPELIEEEIGDVVEGHARRLAQFGLTLEGWLQKEGKTIEKFVEEVRPDVEKRLRTRFGILTLIRDFKLEVTEEEMRGAIEKLLQPIPEAERSKLRGLYEPGGRAHEQFKFQRLMEKVLERLMT